MVMYYVRCIRISVSVSQNLIYHPQPLSRGRTFHCNSLRMRKIHGTLKLCPLYVVRLHSMLIKHKSNF